MSGLIERHAVATARELAYAAGVPFRDRYGYASPDEEVLKVIRLVAANPDMLDASAAIFAANTSEEIELASGSDTPITEEQERALVAAVRPVSEWWTSRTAGVAS